VHGSELEEAYGGAGNLSALIPPGNPEAQPGGGRQPEQGRAAKLLAGHRLVMQKLLGMTEAPT
jgi:hypothetical protein